MEDWSTHSDKYDAEHRGETKYDAPLTRCSCGNADFHHRYPGIIHDNPSATRMRCHRHVSVEMHLRPVCDLCVEALYIQAESTEKNIALWIRWNSTPMLRDLIGSLAAELRLRMHTDASNYLAKAVACLEEK